MISALNLLRDATRNTRFENNLYLVGGILRDRFLGLPVSDDVDIVLEEDAVALAEELYQMGLSSHFPVSYPRFGTAMVTIDGTQIEFVTARAERYDPSHRKPEVEKASLVDDAYRRDFTINTLMENLHTGEKLDITGRGLNDLQDGIIRTPLEPARTFYDDPLRMLRAVRFAARFQFDIDPETEASIVRESHRLNLLIEGPVVSAERIREEFTRILMGPAPVQGLRKLHSLGILRQFAPEISAMEGVEQNEWHLYDVWEHTLKAVEAMVTANREASLVERLAILFHDIGKGPTKTEDESGIHFYNHQFVGAKMTATIMNRLKFSNQVVDDVTRLVELHMRLGEYKPEWGDSAIRRLIRSIYPHKEPLFRITAADMAAMRQDVPTGDLVALRERMDRVDAAGMMALFDSPLDGLEIMEVLSIGPGPILKEAKDFLINQVLEGLLGATDKDLSRKQLKEWYARR